MFRGGVGEVGTRKPEADVKGGSWGAEPPQAKRMWSGGGGGERGKKTPGGYGEG